jgi:hypothetical protein
MKQQYLEFIKNYVSDQQERVKNGEHYDNVELLLSNLSFYVKEAGI